MNKETKNKETKNEETKNEDRLLQFQVPAPNLGWVWALNSSFDWVYTGVDTIQGKIFNTQVGNRS